MQSSNKKIAAAISAVMQFLQEEESRLVQVVAASTHAPSFSPWGVAGRQDAMLFRSLWQRRLGRGC